MNRVTIAICLENCAVLKIIKNDIAVEMFIQCIKLVLISEHCCSMQNNIFIRLHLVPEHCLEIMFVMLI
jgi:hypothetical protein